MTGVPAPDTAAETQHDVAPTEEITAEISEAAQ